MVKTSFTLLIAFFLLTACNLKQDRNNPASDKIDSFKWLSGKWIQEMPNGNLTESWVKANDSTMSGYSVMTSGTDTLFNEQMTLLANKTAIMYIPVVKNQNEGKPVIFTLVDSSAGRFVFENKMHDFPQRIVYQPVSNDSLLAWIEGDDKGNFRKEEFRFKRQTP